MKLVAEILTGSLFYVEVEDDATVSDLKKEIARQENLPGDRLILLLDGGADEERHSMDKDEASLKDYGVEDSSHIYIFFQSVLSVASSANPSTPKEYASTEPSSSMDSSKVPTDNKDEASDEEPADQEKPAHEAN